MASLRSFFSFPFFVVLLFLAAAASALAEGAHVPPKADPQTARLHVAPKARLHVMSYNIKGLPSMLLSSDWKDGRYALIAKALNARLNEGSGPEIVALQEAFSEPAVALLKESGYPHVAAGPEAVSMLGVSGGLFLLSKYKILHEAKRAFGPKLCLSWDCFSNKGVQMARFEVPGLPRPLEVFNTHLQAGREDTEARRAQVRILLEFFKKEHVPGNPVIFAGDFNFRPGLGQKSYKDFDEGLGLLHAGKFCLEKGCAKGNDEGWHGIWERAVDHQFFTTEGEVRFTPLLVERSYREPVDGMRLSDHPAHEVRYELSWGANGAAEMRAEAIPGGGGGKALASEKKPGARPSAPARSETSAP